MSTESRPDVIIIGVGNPALSDEGAAGRVIRRLRQQGSPELAIIDAGLPGPGLVGLLEGRTKAIIIDAVDAARPPGTVFSFRPEQVPRTRQSSRPYTLHEGNVLEYVELARALGTGPREVVFIGIQPHDLSPGEQLSPPVRAAIPQAATMALAEARNHVTGPSENRAMHERTSSTGIGLPRTPP